MTKVAILSASRRSAAGTYQNDEWIKAAPIGRGGLVWGSLSSPGLWDKIKELKQARNLGAKVAHK